MATERDLELLDDYIGNRLAGDDKHYIEQRLEQDPDLKSELVLQQHITAGLRKARAAELKQMLNNVQVPPLRVSQKATYTKFAGATIVFLLGLSFVFYFMHSNNADVAVNELPEAIVNTEPPVKTDINPIQKEVPDSDEDEVQNQAPVKKEKPKLIQKAPEQDRNTSLNVFDPTSELENEDQNVPADIGTGAVSGISDMIVETETANRKYNFHYKISDDKIVLYGAFEKNLYEILEFITDEKRTTFLFYKDAYYLLKPNAGNVSPLTPVNDPILLKKLREHKNSAQ